MTVDTGELDESLTEDGKRKAAVDLGRRGGLAQALNLSKRRRIEIAMNAVMPGIRKAKGSQTVMAHRG